MTLDLAVAQLAPRLALDPRLSATLGPLHRLPTAVLWNRLEGRPRADDLARPLRAEVRDPLWLLGRQWQFGEFAGEDAGMPVRATLAAETTALTSVTLGTGPGAAPAPYDGLTPLEAVVERRPIEADLLMGLHVGRRWLAALAGAFGAADPIVASFRAAYAFAAPAPVAPDPAAPDRPPPDLAALQVATHRAELVARTALARASAGAGAGRVLDGARLLADVAGALGAGGSPSDAFVARGAGVADDRRAAVDALAAALAPTLGIGPAAPAPGSAWVPERLEHAFTLGAAAADGTEARLAADRYAGGHLDWYAVDAAAPGPAAAGAPRTERRVASFVPTPVRFAGMPNVRWWEFEDRRVGFGLTTAAKTDLVKLLLAQFGLVFSNDWFLVPFAAAVGTLVDVAGIVVTDNFGVHTLVEPTARRAAALGQAGRWGMWTLDRRDAPGAVDARFFLAPALARSLESKPLDEVVFLRDEVANLVWGVEAVTPDPLGGGRDARGAGTRLREAIARAYPEPPLPPDQRADDVPLAYQLMGHVPEHWIPFVSVRLAGQPTATAVLQGAMPRVPPVAPVLDGAGAPVLAHNVVLPRGTLLARDPVAEPNLIFEEEVLRGGAVVRRTVQQARAADGATVTWSGRQKRNGRGEGSSGLAFDQVTLRRPDAP